MGLLTFSINVTLDGCVDHQEGIADDETHAFFTRLMDENGAIANCRALEAQAINDGSFSRLLAKDEISTYRLVSGGRNETAPAEACRQTAREFLRQFGHAE